MFIIFGTQAIRIRYSEVLINLKYTVYRTRCGYVNVRIVWTVTISNMLTWMSFKLTFSYESSCCRIVCHVRVKITSNVLLFANFMTVLFKVKANTLHESICLIRWWIARERCSHENIVHRHHHLAIISATHRCLFPILREWRTKNSTSSSFIFAFARSTRLHFYSSTHAKSSSDELDRHDFWCCDRMSHKRSRTNGSVACPNTIYGSFYESSWQPFFGSPPMSSSWTFSWVHLQSTFSMRDTKKEKLYRFSCRRQNKRLEWQQRHNDAVYARGIEFANTQQ